MQYKDAINPKAVHPEDPYIIVNSLTDTIVISWFTEDGAERVCNILNKHSERIANKRPYRVIKNEEDT